MITLYGVLKFVHVLGAAIWLGSNATTVFGTLFTSRALNRVTSLGDVEAAPELDGLLARIQLGIFLDLVLVAAVICVMVTKPTF